MSRNGRPARVGREKRKAVEESNGPGRKIRRRLANIGYQEQSACRMPFIVSADKGDGG